MLPVIQRNSENAEVKSWRVFFLLKLNLGWAGWVNHCTCSVSEEQWFSVEMCYSWVCYEHDCFLQASCAWMVHTAFETVSPQVAMLSPAFYQWFMWFMCKLLKIPVQVKDKAPEVCFLSVDMSGFECLIQLMNCKMKVFMPGVHWDCHWGVNHIISL